MSEEQNVEPVVEKPSVEEPSVEPLIITCKQKNPKNVAAGKLGALSKAAKKKKMQRLLEQQEQHSYARYAIVAVGVSVLATVSYKFLFPKKEEPEKVYSEEKVESPERKKIQRGKPISMFD